MKLSLFLMPLVLFSFVFIQSAQAETKDIKWLADDFSASEAPNGWKSTRTIIPFFADPRAACEKHLRKALCVNNWNTEDIVKHWSTIPCDADSESFLPTAMQLYDEMPDRVRPLYCSVERIFLSDKITSVAFAHAILKKGEAIGAFIGARKSTFSGAITSHELVTWKEQLIYGGSEVFLSNDPQLVQIDYDIQMTEMKSDAIFYVMMHELGHIIDAQNNVSESISNAGWSALSWKSWSRPMDGAGYAHRDDICYYRCRKKLGPETAPEIYSSLRDSAFITTYSGMNSAEDFAEFWTWNLLSRTKDARYTITVPSGPVFEMNSVLQENPKIKAKLDWAQGLWDSPTTKIGW